MKLVSDDGELIEELDDDAALLVFMPDGGRLVVFETMDDDDEVPGHVLLAAATAGFLNDDEHVEQVTRWMQEQTGRGSH